jgi:molybdopterin converting factor subunit 1
VELRLLLFAMLRDEVGETYRVDLPEGSRVADLRRALRGAHPAFARLGDRCLVAVNETYARDEDPLRERDEVAILPPVAGG